MPVGGNTSSSSDSSGLVSSSPVETVWPSSPPSAKSRASPAAPSASAARSVRKTRSTRSSPQTRATSLAAVQKSSLRAARIAPLIAPAEAPATIEKGEGRPRSAGISATRLSTPA